MDNSSPQNRATLALRRAAVAILGALRRVLASIFQVVFRDQLRDIKEKTDRLGSASVESVTYLGGEVRALDERLAKIERELAGLRKVLESREAAAEEGEEVSARPPGG